MSYADREPAPELRRLEAPDGVQMAAPNAVGEGTIIIFPDVLSLDVQTETARDVKERPWMRVDPTPPGTDIGDDDNAFPFAYRQGVYVAMSSANKGGEAVPVPDSALDSQRVRQTSVQEADSSYAIPWGWATIDNFEARPVVGRAGMGTVKKVRSAIASVLTGNMGPGQVSRGGSGGRGGRR